MDQQETAERKGREGGRWINERPSSEEFGQWFASNMKIDEKLKAEDYLGGVVLIPAVDTKSKHVTGFHNGQPVIEERPELAFIPYAKVETRVAYFWDLLGAHEEWVGVVERITPPRMPVTDIDPVEEEIEEPMAEGMMRTVTRTTPGKAGALATMVHQLPQGFSIMSVPVGEGYSHFLCCTTRVAIYDRAEYKEDPRGAVPLRQGQGTKQVPLLGSYQTRVWADNSSLMKAETGAFGRALGFAGIFVIPGSGVATAEDMMEAAAQGDTPTSGPAAPAETNQGPAAPEAPVARTGAEQAQDEETQLRLLANELWKELKENYPGVAQNKFGPWAAERRLTSVSDAKGAMLKGLVKKLEKLLDEAKTATAEREGADVPAEASETPEPAGEGATGDGDEPSGQAG